MARNPRKQEPGWYHIYNRANNRRSINLCKDTYQIFLSLLESITESYNADIHAYCLMTNHYHFLINTKEPNLANAMRDFGRQYAIHINKFTKGSGPAFTNRYQSRNISNEAYLVQVFRYIHLNPVDAKKCKHVIDYDWSSISHYTNSTPNTFLKTDFFGEKFIDTNDLINFHDMGNSEPIKKYYKQKRKPTIIDLKY